LEKTTSGEAGESCVNEAVFKTPLKPGDVQLRPSDSDLYAYRGRNGKILVAPLLNDRRS
jgi:hypothetical protein